MAITITDNDISSNGTLTLNNKQVADVAFTGSYDDLIDKPTNDGNSQVVEVWVADDHSQWYRKWNDGYIEQFGIVSNVLEQNWTDVTFPIPFTTNCNVLVDKTRHTAGCSYVYGIIQNSVTLTEFSVKSDSWDDYGNGNIEKIYWQATGY